MTLTLHSDWTPAQCSIWFRQPLRCHRETCVLQCCCSWPSPKRQRFSFILADMLKPAESTLFSDCTAGNDHTPLSSFMVLILSPALTHTCPFCWMLMVLLFIPIMRKLCESELSSSVNEGSALTSWARSSGQEPGSSYRWPSNVTANWSATNRAWSYGERQNEKDIVAIELNPPWDYIAKNAS